MENELNELLVNGHTCLYQSELEKFKAILKSKNIDFCCWYDDNGGVEVDLKK